jgi:hypothetical protein
MVAGTAEVSFAWIFRTLVQRERSPQPSESSNARRASADSGSSTSGVLLWDADYLLAEQAACSLGKQG